MDQRWFLRKERGDYGPYSWEQMQQYAREGRLEKEDLVKSDAMAEWATASEVPGLSSLVRGASPSTHAKTDPAFSVVVNTIF